MAHGAPDYSNVRKEGLTYRVDDMSELAVRLGSPVTYDRRGDVLWLDNFDNGLLGWEVTESGVGAEVGLSTEYRENGPFSAKLKTGGSLGNVVRIKRYQSLVANPKLGFNVAWLADDNIDNFNINCDIYTGSQRYLLRVYFDFDEDELFITASGSNPIINSGIDDLRGGKFFNHVKAAFDLVDYGYLYLVVNENEYDISQYGPNPSGSSDDPHIECWIQASEFLSGSANVYIDHFILTTNEE